MEPAKVVIRYADGRIIKGYTQDFLPTNPSFHVHPLAFSTSMDAVDILVRDLKAVFLFGISQEIPIIRNGRIFRRGKDYWQSIGGDL